MPNKDSNKSRLQIPQQLQEELMDAARRRGRPERYASTLLQNLARQWIETDDVATSPEALGIREVSARLDRIEAFLERLSGHPTDTQDRNLRESPPLDEPAANKRDRRDKWTVNQRKILKVLVDHANSEGLTCELSLERLKELEPVGATRKPLGTIIKKLEDRGLIEIAQPPGGASATRYQVDLIMAQKVLENTNSKKHVS